MNNPDENREIQQIDEFLDGNAIRNMEIEVRPQENLPPPADANAVPDLPRGGLGNQADINPNRAGPQLAQEGNNLVPVRADRNPLNNEGIEELEGPRVDPPQRPHEAVAGQNNNRQRYAPYRGNRAGYRVQRQRRAREFVQFLGMLRRQAYQFER